MRQDTFWTDSVCNDVIKYYETHNIVETRDYLKSKYSRDITFPTLTRVLASIKSVNSGAKGIKNIHMDTAEKKFAALGIDMEKEVRRLIENNCSYEVISKSLNQKAGKDICNTSSVRSWCRRRNLTHQQHRNLKIVEDSMPETLGTCQEMVENEKDMIISKAKDRLIRELTKKQALSQLLCEAIEASILTLPKIDTKVLKVQAGARRDTGARKDEEVCLLLGDVHFGERTTAEETGGLIDYGAQSFQLQIDELYKAVTSIKEIHEKAYNVPRLNVLCLGDIISNDMLFPGQSTQVDQNVTNQVFNCAHEFRKFFLKLLDVFPEIHIYCVMGNHGRVSGKPGERPITVNWDWLTYKFLEYSLKDEKRIKFTVSDTWYLQAVIQGHTFTITHGEDIRGYLGTPFYGVEKAEMKYNKMLPPSNYFCIGHFHRWGVFDTGTKSQVLINGAWPGGSIFSAKRLMSISRPTQLCFGVNAKRGKTWLYDLKLD